VLEANLGEEARTTAGKHERGDDQRAHSNDERVVSASLTADGGAWRSDACWIWRHGGAAEPMARIEDRERREVMAIW
jgi:hypothetical protein